MLKTNSKEFKTKIKNWIVENFDSSSYEPEEKKPANYEEIKQFIARICWRELGFEVRIQHATVQKMFIHWCEGLPSCLNTAAYLCHCSAVDLVGDILQQTKEERNKYSEREAEQLMTYLIYKELIRAF